MGKTPGLLRTRDELGRSGNGGSVTTPSVLGQLGRPVAYRATRSGSSASRYMGCAQASGWDGEKFSANGREEK
jgi:hypothetical protein